MNERRTKGSKAAAVKSNGVGGDERPDASAFVFDQHDESIIACLREDGRISVRELGERVGLNEATVRSRMRRLEENAAMRVVAMVDLSAIGFQFIAPVGIQVRGRSVESVGHDLAALERVLTVSSSVGVRDLEIQLIAKDSEELRDLLVRVLPGIEGVASIEASLALDVRKYETPWVPII